MKAKLPLLLLQSVFLTIFTAEAVGAEYFGLDFHVWPEWVEEKSTDSVRYSLPGMPVFCGIEVFKPFRIPSGEFNNWYQQEWSTFLHSFTIQRRFPQYSEARCEASSKGQVHRLMDLVYANYDNRWDAAIGFSVAKIRDRVHPILYLCQDMNAHVRFFGHFKDALTNAWVLPPGYHNDWSEENDGSNEQDPCREPSRGGVSSCISECSMLLSEKADCIAQCMTRRMSR
jgi:hypothetical protein